MKQAVFIINSLQNGGAERVVTTQADYLQRNGIQVTIICLRKWVQYDIRPDIKLVFLSSEKKFSPLSYLSGLFRLRKRLNRELDKIINKGEIILLTSNLLYPDLITRLSRYSRKAIYVLHAHQDILPFAGNPLYKGFVKWLYTKRHVVCVGDSVAEELCGIYHIDRRMVEAVVNPVDGQNIDRMKEESLEFEGPFVLFCGRLTALKHPERVLRAFYTGRFYEQYRLVILGIGEMEARLRNMAEEYGIADRVCFMGWEKNVYKWMAKASLLILASDTEGLSMTLIEALYCECPVVAVRSQGPSQIMQGELKEYLCASFPEAIAVKMREALSDYPRGLREYTAPYSVEKSLERYLEIYQEWNESLR